MSPATPRTCSVARTLDVVGEKWSLLVLREVFLGVHRFDEIARNTGAPRDVLAARLKTLVDAGVLRRVPYSEHPPRAEYHATDSGRDLRPVILVLMAWGDRYLAGEDGPPLTLQHSCGEAFHAEVVCAACHQPVRRSQLSPPWSGPDHPETTGAADASTI